MSFSEAIEWRETPEGLLAFHLGDRVEWAPQEGSQVAFLDCPVFECLYEGTRGPGKTDALLMDFAQHCGQGYGEAWRGLLFRRTYPELRDVIDKSLNWFSRAFPEAKYNKGEHYWEWPGGEKLYFRHFKNEADYWSYHGHAYPWIGWEELTTWPDDYGFKKMQSCSRSTHPDLPRKYRSTTNPYGVGHNWVKLRYRLPIAAGKIKGPIIRDARDFDGNLEPQRVAIHGELLENKILMHAEPDYVSKIRAAARNHAELRAWLYGDWNIVAGGMFDDLWNPRVHVVPGFPFQLTPLGWRVDRSYDHGQSAPFSVGWWAQSNGEPVYHDNRVYGAVPGDIYRIAEWYGWNGRPNEGVRMLSRDIAAGILERQKDWGLKGRVKPGPADSSIYDDFEPGKSVAGEMASRNVRWEHADKGPGSRKQGWEQLRKLMKGALPVPNGPREHPGLFVFERCDQFIRTVPVLPRSDKDMDDVDTEAEDHTGDEARYRVRRKRRDVAGGRFR